MVDSGATHNFIIEAKARRLRLHRERDSGKMNVVNSIALPIVGLMKRTTIKLGGWKGPVDFVVVKMDDFDVVLGMEFLLEHQVIPMPSAKCLAITGSFPTIVQADIRQPNGFKMISVMQLDESCAQEEPPFMEIPLGALEKKEETVPKDTLCVLEKCQGVMLSSWPKSSSMRTRTDHGIKSPLEVKAHAKNAYRMAPPELAKLRKPSKMLLNTRFNRPVPTPYGVYVLSLKKKDRSPQQRIDRRIQSKLTVRRKYPLPALARMLDHPCRVKYFPKLDI
ncbi:gag-asp_proteas domain-containing protein [Cucumis melo var. makuwa]|uniref:Gag-asp_proteas domain-containing protein n=1 Tax=Cucumis melo var. makuwa TaxID=1194695 RepID=A0A5A7TAL5_CUCMM|nr:gag-asp_proteas domain-containing protein [Cucumis melo var. makuwa]